MLLFSICPHRISFHYYSNSPAGPTANFTFHSPFSLFSPYLQNLHSKNRSASTFQLKFFLPAQTNWENTLHLRFSSRYLPFNWEFSTRWEAETRVGRGRHKLFKWNFRILRLLRVVTRWQVGNHWWEFAGVLRLSCVFPLLPGWSEWALCTRLGLLRVFRSGMRVLRRFLRFQSVRCLWCVWGWWCSRSSGLQCPFWFFRAVRLGCRCLGFDDGPGGSVLACWYNQYSWPTTSHSTTYTRQSSHPFPHPTHSQSNLSSPLSPSNQTPHSPSPTNSLSSLPSTLYFSLNFHSHLKFTSLLNLF